MKFLYSLGGANIPVIREFDIDAVTKFENGQIVKISTDAVLAPDAPGGCIGVAAEDHTGEKDILNKRNNGSKLRIDITRDAVYAVNAPKLTATGGSASTFVCNASGITTNLSKSKLVLVRKGENSENTDSAGSVRKVKTVTVSGSTATFTVDAGSVICEGDVYAVIPEYGYKGYVSDNGKDFGFAMSSVSPELYVVNYDTDTLVLEVMLKKDYIA